MRILIIEDEIKIANFIKKGLKEEGYVADIAVDGKEGLDFLYSNSYDLVILDLMLPKIDGITICSEVRKRNINTPILILSAKDTVKDKVTGLDSGADDYLTKPFSFEELLARIRALLRGKANKEVTKLKVDDLEMDLLNHTVKRGDKEISLSTKEYMLLEYLMRNAGTVVTRTMIAENVWGLDFDSYTNIIDVYINYLRNKIDKDSNKKLLHTVRGRGYMIKSLSGEDK
ncbi:MAG TPA: response regulator transcription factor [Spirochaetota bacterium]|nr:response regulator transcription factor [Spirochaetota bacterium]HOL57774.1 response regulator transcription factor [Spirochaetota bacterium]HPP05309.1 response regulator transcription factor [Spirochaetota bacterium]